MWIMLGEKVFQHLHLTTSIPHGSHSENIVWYLTVFWPLGSCPHFDQLILSQCYGSLWRQTCFNKYIQQRIDIWETQKIKWRLKLLTAPNKPGWTGQQQTWISQRRGCVNRYEIQIQYTRCLRKKKSKYEHPKQAIWMSAYKGFTSERFRDFLQNPHTHWQFHWNWVEKEDSRRRLNAQIFGKCSSQVCLGWSN